MSFQPVVLQSGLAGWAFLKRTYASQMEAYREAPDKQSDVAYFTVNIGKVETAADLVGDRRLLQVALGAFGLQDDLGNRAFVQRILEDGTASADALANRLTDGRYRTFSAAFGFGPAAVPNTGDTAEMSAIAEAFWQQSFQSAVGEQDNDMRITLYAQDALAEIAGSGSGDTASWFSALGEPPLRQLFETAFGLPSSFSQIDLDKQLEILRDKTRGLTGRDDFAQFADPVLRDRITDRFLAMSQIAATGSGLSSAATALTLLQAAS